MKSNCEFRNNGCWVRPCRHPKEFCGLYHLTQQYNEVYQQDLCPTEVIIKKLENHHYSDLEEAVIVKALGLEVLER